MNPLKFPELVGKPDKKIKASLLVNLEMYSTGIVILECLIARAKNMTSEQLIEATRCPDQDARETLRLLNEAKDRCVKIMLELYSAEEMARDLIGRAFQDFNDHIKQELVNCGHKGVLAGCRETVDNLKTALRDEGV